MANLITLQTPRLKLRQWQESDLPAFARLNADAEVMEFFPDCLNPAQSDAQARRLQTSLAANGWGFWALELRASGEFIGLTGIQQKDDLPFSPCVEIGWRVAKEHWRRGYASEAAQRSLAFAFTDLLLPEVVSFTTINNLPSQGVMEKLGMCDTGKNFAHPAVPPGHKLREHVLYSISRGQWHHHQSINQ